MIFIKLLSRLPLSALYLLADFLFFVSYYLIRYRREIVWKNLNNSFPEKSKQELRKIERDFYKYLADISVETVKLLTISEEDLLRRVKIDSSLTLHYNNLGYSIFGMTAHFSNWEWLLVACTNQLGPQIHAVYQRLRNPGFNELMKRIRSRFGVILHEKNEAVREIYKLGKQSYLMSMVADQRPFSGEKKYWTEFLNQDSAFYLGTEVLARRLDIKVVFARMIRIKRGYYEVDFQEISQEPKKTKPHEITEKFIQMTERTIRQDPAAYLWSHDRWKHKRTKE